MNNYSVHNYHLDLFLFHLEKLHFLVTYLTLENEENEEIIPDIPNQTFEYTEEPIYE